MTDSEINLAIAKIEYPAQAQIERPVGELTPSIYVSGIGLVDYVNDWSDIGPIIEREGVWLSREEFCWVASFYYSYIYATAETPTKAAALCYLKMKGVEL